MSKTFSPKSALSEVFGCRRRRDFVSSDKIGWFSMP